MKRLILILTALAMAAEAFAQKPDIHILATGGTIAGTGAASNETRYNAGQLAIGQLAIVLIAIIIGARLGIALGISPMMLIALFPAVNGYFFIPNYPTIVAAINFDRTGTTRIGKWILNHSFMMPGLITTVTSIAVGLLLISF